MAHVYLNCIWWFSLAILNDVIITIKQTEGTSLNHIIRLDHFPWLCRGRTVSGWLARKLGIQSTNPLGLSLTECEMRNTEFLYQFMGFMAPQQPLFLVCLLCIHSTYTHIRCQLPVAKSHPKSKKQFLSQVLPSWKMEWLHEDTINVNMWLFQPN